MEHGEQHTGWLQAGRISRRTSLLVEFHCAGMKCVLGCWITQYRLLCLYTQFHVGSHLCLMHCMGMPI